ncbi:TetR/AcrR family transcriptional regulator [Streptomyces sp. NPDC006368]|uniref:TetR/AcrR family transcriptional regulator n=1 Tax=Streptomyces sp. NPDC006368 TaxID=3156760 RepID=UPI0033B50BE0
MQEPREHDTGLRARLVETGVELVTGEGTQSLSLREIARRAGVSHGAPRRYFPTHLSLLSAIAREGFTALAARAAEAIGAIGDGGDAGVAGPTETRGGARTASPRDQLLALGRVYLDFALTNRGMFELMFRHDLPESDALGPRGTSLPLFDMFVDLVGRAGPRTDAPPDVVAGALWANLHGIAQLWGRGSLRPATGSDDVEPLLRAAIDAHLGPGRR